MVVKAISYLMAFSLAACMSANALERRSSVPATSLTDIPPVDTPGAVFTAEQIYNTIIHQSPYLTQMTSTVVWTASSTPSASA
ncbi:hypothetical protein PILCRDRAFT_819345 [Piloderma croceum F 1598]|uniref:Uncharacterized protein n=1 Tax=Piloderma croceum (strain F 1598) TaxID=765440 RepID=A0A0C3BBP6_PILCF|nr:hypothetical protein PILCRDRAFT_819345 [Piloderma croceum F 1598]